MSITVPSLRGVLSVPSWARNPLWKSAAAVPSLDLRFADNKSLIDAVSNQNLITFTRASEGTFVNSQGQIQAAAINAPRFDHNPTTGESLGLLVEEQRTNLVLNSATFQPTSGSAPASYTVDQIAPDGTLTASRQTAAAPRAFVDYTGIANATYTFSFYCRVMSGTATFSMQIKNAASDTVLASDNTPIATTTWRRFSITGTTNGAATGARIELSNVTTGFVFWGAQLEAGAFPTSVIPTAGSAATRAADVASISGSNFSSWYRQDEGTVFADSHLTQISNSPVVADLNDNSTSNRISLGFTTGRNAQMFFNTGGVSQGATNTSNATELLSVTKSALAFRQDDTAISLSGASTALDNSVTLPTVSQLTIGYRINSQFLNGRIRRLTYWPQRLPNATLQSITQ